MPNSRPETIATVKNAIEKNAFRTLARTPRPNFVSCLSAINALHQSMTVVKMDCDNNYRFFKTWVYVKKQQRSSDLTVTAPFTFYSRSSGVPGLPEYLASGRASRHRGNLGG